jgi:hypothetical protein
MFVKQLYTNCLSEAAYFIASDGEAVVIDPLRDIDTYIALAKEHNAVIKYIFETHFHADFVSGHIELAKATGDENIILAAELLKDQRIEARKAYSEFMEKVGDIASIKLDKCPHCGRLGETITKRPRRTGGLLKVKGLLINPDLISEFLSGIQLINEFQIIIRKENLSDVDSLDLLVIKLDAFETNHDYLVGFLANEIKKIVMIKPVIEFASLGEIYDPMKNMKIKRVLDLRV